MKHITILLIILLLGVKGWGQVKIHEVLVSENGSMYISDNSPLTDYLLLQWFFPNNSKPFNNNIVIDYSGNNNNALIKNGWCLSNKGNVLASTILDTIDWTLNNAYIEFIAGIHYGYKDFGIVGGSANAGNYISIDTSFGVRFRASSLTLLNFTGIKFKPDSSLYRIKLFRKPDSIIAIKTSIYDTSFINYIQRDAKPIGSSMAKVIYTKLFQGNTTHYFNGRICYLDMDGNKYAFTEGFGSWLHSVNRTSRISLTATHVNWVNQSDYIHCSLYGCTGIVLNNGAVDTIWFGYSNNRKESYSLRGGIYTTPQNIVYDTIDQPIGNYFQESNYSISNLLNNVYNGYYKPSTLPSVYNNQIFFNKNTQNNLLIYKKPLTKNIAQIVCKTIDVSYFGGKSWLAVGDSYCSVPTTNATYFKYTNEYYIFADTVQYLGYPGVLMTYFKEKIIDSVLIYSDFLNRDLITLYGGTNDYRNNMNLNQFADSLTALINYVVTNKGTNTYLLVVTPSYFGVTHPNTLGLYITDYVNKMVEICNTLNVSVLNMYTSSNINSSNLSEYMPDNLHPTTTKAKTELSLILKNKINSLY